MLSIWGGKISSCFFETTKKYYKNNYKNYKKRHWNYAQQTVQLTTITNLKKVGDIILNLMMSLVLTIADVLLDISIYPLHSGLEKAIF